MNTDYPLSRTLLGLALLFSLSAPQAELIDQIVAIVNEDVIMQSELERKMHMLHQEIQQQGGQTPPLSLLREQVLEKSIDDAIQLQIAQSTGIKIDDETLNKTLNKIAQQNNMSLAEFHDALEAKGYNYERFIEDIRNEISITRLQERYVKQHINVSPSEIDRLLAEKNLQGDLNSEFHLSHILVAIKEGFSKKQIEAARLLAIQTQKEASSHHDFAELAKKISDSTTAAQGGDLGWRAPDTIPSLFVEHIPNMSIGEVSQVIESANGFHIIKLNKMRINDKQQVVIKETHARHILVHVDQITSHLEAEKKLYLIKKRIEAGEDFSSLAKAHSDDKISALEGGDLGWTQAGQLAPSFEKAMGALEPGEISDPFRSEFGWHIVQVLERRLQDNTMQARRNQARSMIYQRKLKVARENWLQDLRNKAYIKYRIE